MNSYEKIAKNLDKLVSFFGSDYMAEFLEELNPDKNISIKTISKFSLISIANLYEKDINEVLNKKRRHYEELDIFRLNILVLKRRYNTSYQELGLLHNITGKRAFDCYAEAMSRENECKLFKKNLEKISVKLDAFDKLLLDVNKINQVKNNRNLIVKK